MMIKSFSIILATLLLVGMVSGTPTPSTTCASSTAGSGNNVFGIPASSKRTGGLPASNPLQVRGGELHEPETVEDVDALVLQAASQHKLVVIDFTASW